MLAFIRQKPWIFAIVNVFLVSYMQLKFLDELSKGNVDTNFRNDTLLIIAHPDDETMFFGPTIINLIERDRNLTILCLSDGNANNLGAKRIRELNEVVKAFGPRVSFNIIDNIGIVDGMNVEWDADVLSKIIGEYIKSNRLEEETVITFDSYGVSGHPNHRSIYKALLSLANQLKSERRTNYFVLESVSIWRKYISFLDTLIIKVLQSLSKNNSTSQKVILAINFSENALLRQVLALHESQMEWFRLLYMTFSRYMFINDLLPLDAAKA